MAAQFGFEPYDACVLESESLYIRKAGDEITGQLYNFADSDRRVALRPEMTPSLARMVSLQGRCASHCAGTRFPSARYERMQRGRKREHYQWNMDVLAETVAAEVELMSAQVAFLERVGLGGAVSFRVSDRRLLEVIWRARRLLVTILPQPADCRQTRQDRSRCHRRATGRSRYSG